MFSEHLVVESLFNLLFGMIGIFVVMGIIFLALHGLHRFTRNKHNDEPEQ